MANAWESAPLANSTPATGAQPPAGGTPAWQSAPLANPPATSVMDNNGLLGRMDAAIGGPGNTLRGPIRDVGRWADTVNPWSVQSQQQAAQDTRPPAQHSTDLAAGLAGMAGVTGDTLNTLGIPGGASLNTAQQSFQEHNAPQLQTMTDVGNSLQGIAPADIHAPAVRVPTVAGAAARASEVAGDTLSMVNNPEWKGIKDLAKAAQRDGRSPADVYAQMTPQATNSPKSLDQFAINKMLDMHAVGAPKGDIATALNVSPSTINAYIGRFNNEVVPKFGGQNVYEAFRTPKDNEVVATPNLTREVEDAASTDSKGSALLQQSLLQRQADQADYLAHQINQHAGSENFDAHADAVKSGTAEGASDRYGALYDQPILALQRGDIAHITDNDYFRKAEAAAQLEATVRQKPWPGGDAWTPRQIDLIQQQLRRMAQTINDPTTSGIAGAIRTEFLNTVDPHIEGFAGTRNWYRNQMQRESALDAGKKYATGNDSPSVSVAGGPDKISPSEFFGQHLEALAAADKAVQKAAAALKAKPADAAAAATLKAAREAQAVHGNIVGDFRKSYGAGLQTLLDRGHNADRFLNAIRQRQHLNRINEVFDPKTAASFTNVIRSELRKKASMEIYGNSKTAARQAHASRVKAAGDFAAGVLTGNLPRVWNATTDMASKRWQEQRAHAKNLAQVSQDPLEVRAMMKAMSDLKRPRGKVIAPDQNAIRRQALMAQGAGAGLSHAANNATQPRGFAAGAQ